MAIGNVFLSTANIISTMPEMPLELCAIGGTFKNIGLILCIGMTAICSYLAYFACIYKENDLVRFFKNSTSLLAIYWAILLVM